MKLNVNENVCMTPPYDYLLMKPILTLTHIISEPLKLNPQLTHIHTYIVHWKRAGGFGYDWSLVN